MKTAEDLHIKGLAEVSWRNDTAPNDLNNTGHSPGAATPGVETVLREGETEDPPAPKQRRRGRPPLDDPPSAHDVFTPKITCITGNVGKKTKFGSRNKCYRGGRVSYMYVQEPVYKSRCSYAVLL